MLQTSLPGNDQFVIQVNNGAEQSSLHLHYLHLLLRSRLRWEDMVGLSLGSVSGGSQYMYDPLWASLTLT